MNVLDSLKCCTLCPRNCSINRLNGGKGYCCSGINVKIARSSLHFWEEPCISGSKGSGTVFFSHCTLKCVYCQNYDISTKQNGKEISIQYLANKFLELQNQGANNINLVTPTHFVPQIILSLDIAKSNGLVIPIVYNSSAYENVETIKMLDGYIDVYLPDMKYYNDKYAIKYSNAPNYFLNAKLAIQEMYRQVGKPQFNEDNIMTKGVIVRHLMLPHLLFDSKKILDYLYNTYKDNIYISIMNQYTPLAHVKNFPELNMKISALYYNTLIDYAVELGIENAFVQEGEAADSSFIPNFNSDDI